MTSKKVLHVVSSMDPVYGGVCKAVRIIATSLIAEGVVNEVVCMDNPEADFIGKESFKLHVLGAAGNPWSYHPKLLPWLETNIKTYDYVVIHGLWLYNAYAVYKAIKKLRKHAPSNSTLSIPKYFVMPHGMLDPYFQKARGRRLKALRNWMYWKLIENKVVNKSNGLLFTCEEEAQLAKQSFRPYHPKNELIVGLGVEASPVHTPLMDTAFFSACSEVKGRPFLLFLSRIHEKKGVDLLIKAYKIILDNAMADVLNAGTMNAEIIKGQNKSNTEIPALVIVGPGIETSYGNALMTLINEDPELKNNIFFPGMLSGDAKWGAFYNSEAFVLPSHQENFGIAVVESLACEKPVLISNQINIWKEIKNENGGLVENDTLKGTMKLLDDWVNLSTEEKEIIGVNAKTCFESHFSLDALVVNWKNKVLNT